MATMARLDPSIDDDVRLALALAARSPRFGHVCTRLDVASLPLAVGDGCRAVADVRFPGPTPTRGSGRFAGRRWWPMPTAVSSCPCVLWCGIWIACTCSGCGTTSCRWPLRCASVARPVTKAAPWARRDPTTRPSTPSSTPSSSDLAAETAPTVSFLMPRAPIVNGWPRGAGCATGSRSSPVARARGRPTPWPGCWPPPTWPRGTASVGPRWRWRRPPARRPTV